MKKPPVQARQDQQRTTSHSYLLRLWRTSEQEVGNWHASLEDPSTGERFGFSSLEQLFAFLMEQSERENGLAS
jgi:hypothetical protein